MKRLALTVLVIFLASPAHANDLPGSLFFTPDEAKAIASIVAKEMQSGDPATLRLDALFYYGPEDWVFFLGGIKWVPGDSKPKLHVVSVSSDEVRLQWVDDISDEVREIALKPHQAFQAATGTVIE
jgi:hypothetical protein